MQMEKHTTPKTYKSLSPLGFELVESQKQISARTILARRIDTYLLTKTANDLQEEIQTNSSCPCHLVLCVHLFSLVLILKIISCLIDILNKMHLFDILTPLQSHVIFGSHYDQHNYYNLKFQVRNMTDDMRNEVFSPFILFYLFIYLFLFLFIYLFFLDCPERFISFNDCNDFHRTNVSLLLGCFSRQQQEHFIQRSVLLIG